LTIWLRRARTIISDSAPALNAMNVFPVSDSDTGSNLELTLSGIADALPDLDRPGWEASGLDATLPRSQLLDALVQAAILSAHGNSGAILAEMFTSVCRALEHDQPQLRSLQPGSLLALLLRAVSTAANRAVARPVAGTILTVADAAADSAEGGSVSTPDDALAVARAAQAGARAALARTPEQLEVLAKAGVVDAGGQAFVLLLDALVEVLGGEPAEALPPPGDVSTATVTRTRSVEEYEVMYAITGAAAERLDRLREALSDRGHSVVIVGDSTVAQVHVHLDDAGAAIEAALGLGRLSRIRVTALDAGSRTEGRSVVSAVAGAGLAEAVRAMGGVPVGADRPDNVLEELTAAVEHAAGDVVVLPNGMLSPETVTQLTGQFDGSRRVTVIPTVAQIQGLAAMAVHEPSADFESTVVAMSNAAGHARHGGVTIAERAAITMAGPCRHGDVLGLVEGDIVEIGSSVVEVGSHVIGRLLATGGELLTLVAGEGVEVGAIDELARRAHGAADGLEVQIVNGGQRRYVLLVGLE